MNVFLSLASKHTFGSIWSSINQFLARNHVMQWKTPTAVNVSCPGSGANTNGHYLGKSKNCQANACNHDFIRQSFFSVALLSLNPLTHTLSLTRFDSNAPTQLSSSSRIAKMCIFLRFSFTVWCSQTMSPLMWSESVSDYVRSGRTAFCMPTAHCARWCSSTKATRIFLWRRSNFSIRKASTPIWASPRCSGR